MTGTQGKPRDFWARRKAAVEAEQQADEQARSAAEVQAREAALAERSDEELLADLDLPVPETLEDPAELRKFLTDAVPQRLKTRALRRMWRLNPVLANLDGLVDYGGDFTDSALVVENMQTAYQVGKGMLKHIEEMARQAEAREAAQNETSGEVPGQARDAEPEAPDLDAAMADGEVETAAAGTAPATEPGPPALAPEEDEATMAPARRRMRFHFDSEQHT